MNKVKFLILFFILTLHFWLGRPASENVQSVRAVSAAPGKLKLHINGKARKEIPNPNIEISTGRNESDSFGDLVFEVSNFLYDNRSSFELASDNYAIDFARYANFENHTYIHFGQSYEYDFYGKKLSIPVAGATAVAVFDAETLSEVNASFKSGPELEFFDNPGFDVSTLSDNEFRVFVEYLKMGSEENSAIRRYFNLLPRLSRGTVNFNYDSFLQAEFTEQKSQLTLLLENLNARATKFVIEQLVKKKRLELVQRRDWRFKVTGIFDLDLIFDIEIPKRPNQKLKLRNLREAGHSMAFQVFDNPEFPQGTPEEINESSPAYAIFQKIHDFMRDEFRWYGFDGRGGPSNVEIYTGANGLTYADNAKWISTAKKFVIGRGGSRMRDIDRSPSILAHEYAHGIIQYTSQLEYEGESGALNEHLADLLGVTYEAAHKGTLTVDFTIGEDALTPEIIAGQKQLAKLALASKKPELNRIEREYYNLKKDSVALRHMYSPALSFGHQYTNYKAALADFGEYCEPSVNNNNCGVHMLSGILNRATTMMINTWAMRLNRKAPGHGEKFLQMRKDIFKMFFNTVVNRIPKDSSFADYFRHLFNECQTAGKLDCSVITSAFNSVGVYHPDFPLPDDARDLPQRRAIPPIADPITPDIEVCGPILEKSPGTYEIQTPQLNAKVDEYTYFLNESVRSEFQRNDCGCIEGRISQYPDASGTDHEFVFFDVTSKSIKEHTCPVN